jgi:hypothetical protein
MSLFRKILVLVSSDEDKEKETVSSFDGDMMSIDEQFIYNFKKNFILKILKK